MDIGEYQLEQQIKGFSKLKDADSIIEHANKILTRLIHYPQSYTEMFQSAIVQRCEELGIDINVIQDYYR